MLNSNNNIKKQSKVMIFHPTSTYRATVIYKVDNRQFVSFFVYSFFV